MYTTSYLNDYVDVASNRCDSAAAEEAGHGGDLRECHCVLQVGHSSLGHGGDLRECNCVLQVGLSSLGHGGDLRECHCVLQVGLSSLGWHR